METSQAGIDEYERFVWRMNPPRITIDNTSSETATLFKVESSNRHGILLDVVQLIVDFQLRIRKAYISSDVGWFMDVFHVTDVSGNKVTDPKILAVIEQTISSSHEFSKPQVGLLPSVEHTVIELTGTDRPGLMSEISALLLHMHCNVVSAELWTHNMRVACLLHITEVTGGPICDSEKLSRIKESLCNVLGGDKDPRGARTDFASGITHSERRMHQLMFADRDYERGCDEEDDRPDSDGRITVENCDEKGYSVVNIECKNRHKLVFDTVCTLTDMQYVVFHATIDTEGPRAYQEYYIRHIDGCTLNSQAERRKLIKCLCAAIERRVTEGLRLELCTNDRVGLLTDVTRIFREHGLSVTRADVSTRNNKAIDVFYVSDSSRNPVDVKLIEAVRKKIGQTVLKATQEPVYSMAPHLEASQESRSKFSLGSLFGKPSQVLYNLGLIKSYS